VFSSVQKGKHALFLGGKKKLRSFGWTPWWSSWGGHLCLKREKRKKRSLSRGKGLSLQENLAKRGYTLFEDRAAPEIKKKKKKKKKENSAARAGPANSPLQRGRGDIIRIGGEGGRRKRGRQMIWGKKD